MNNPPPPAIIPGPARLPPPPAVIPGPARLPPPPPIIPGPPPLPPFIPPPPGQNIINNADGGTGPVPQNGKVQPPYKPKVGQPLRNTNQLKYLRQVLKELHKHKFAWPFEEPVDAIALKIPNYHQIITKPMDLGTIKKRLIFYYYKNSTECISDIRQLFQNCYRYNHAGSDVSLMAEALEKSFNEKIDRIPKLEIEIEVVEVSATNSPSRSLLKRNRLCEVKEDFSELFDSGKYSDFIVRCEDQSFHCHKLILARSPVFDTMFNCDMAEAARGEVVVEDMDPTVLSVILRYIYSMKLIKSPDPCSWADIISGANKYDLQELKSFCFEKLLENFSPETAGHVAVAAYWYNASSKFQAAVKEYCQTNIGILMNDPSFRELYRRNHKAFYDD